MARSQAARVKLFCESCKQPHERLGREVWKAQNEALNQPEILNQISFLYKKTRVSLFPTFATFYRFPKFLFFFFFFAHFAWQRLLLKFPRRFCAGNRRKPGKPPYTCPTFDRYVSIVLRRTRLLKTTCAKLSKHPLKIITDRSSSQDFFHTDDQIPRSNGWYSVWRSYSNWLRMRKYLFMKTVSDATQIRLVWARCMLTLKKKTAAIKIIK